MQHYTSLLTRTPQAARIPGEPDMTPNRAGGWGYHVTDEVLLRRFLILGTLEGSFYADGRELTTTAITGLDRLLEDGRGPWVVQTILDVSERGLAPKQQPAILALALALKTAPDVETRRLASAAVARVCRTASTVASFSEALRGLCPPAGTEGRNRARTPIKGRLQRKAVRGCFERWSNEHRLALQVLKYRNREGWRPEDLALLSHVALADPAANDVLSWVFGKHPDHLNPQIAAYEDLKALAELPDADGDEEVRRSYTEQAITLIREGRLPWECVPSRFARDVAVQRELFRWMPVGATVRQLARLTRAGVFKDPEYVRMAAERLTNREQLERARIHPMSLYVAAKVYEGGRSLKGDRTWTPVPDLVEALLHAFLLAIRTAEPTGQRIVYGVDCSGSMTTHRRDVMGVPGLKSAELAFVNAWVMARTEPRAYGLAFDTRVEELDLTRVETLHDLRLTAGRYMSRLGGGTDCAAPILHATQHDPHVDGVVLNTDEETWAGRDVHPIEAIRHYRERWGRPARLVSIGYVAHHYSLVNPITHKGTEDDPGCLAIIGYDASGPMIAAEFLRSEDWTKRTRRG